MHDLKILIQEVSYLYGRLTAQPFFVKDIPTLMVRNGGMPQQPWKLIQIISMLQDLISSVRQEMFMYQSDFVVHILEDLKPRSGDMNILGHVNLLEYVCNRVSDAWTHPLAKNFPEVHHRANCASNDVFNPTWSPLEKRKWYTRIQHHFQCIDIILSEWIQLFDQTLNEVEKFLKDGQVLGDQDCQKYPDAMKLLRDLWKRVVTMNQQDSGVLDLLQQCLSKLTGCEEYSQELELLREAKECLERGRNAQNGFIPESVKENVTKVYLALIGTEDSDTLTFPQEESQLLQKVPSVAFALLSCVRRLSGYENLASALKKTTLQDKLQLLMQRSFRFLPRHHRLARDCANGLIASAQGIKNRWTPVQGDDGHLDTFVHDVLMGSRIVSKANSTAYYLVSADTCLEQVRQDLLVQERQKIQRTEESSHLEEEMEVRVVVPNRLNNDGVLSFEDLYISVHPLLAEETLRNLLTPPGDHENDQVSAVARVSLASWSMEKSAEILSRGQDIPGSPNSVRSVPFLCSKYWAFFKRGLCGLCQNACTWFAMCWCCGRCLKGPAFKGQRCGGAWGLNMFLVLCVLFIYLCLLLLLSILFQEQAGSYELANSTIFLTLLRIFSVQWVKFEMEVLLQYLFFELVVKIRLSALTPPDIIRLAELRAMKRGVLQSLNLEV